jgi:hypothetical protein
VQDQQDSEGIWVLAVTDVALQLTEMLFSIAVGMKEGDMYDNH